jgi:hypothetical protein
LVRSYKGDYFIPEFEIKELEQTIANLVENLGKSKSDDDNRALIHCYKTMGDLISYVSQPENQKRNQYPYCLCLCEMMNTQTKYYRLASDRFSEFECPTELDIETHEKCLAKPPVEKKTKRSPDSITKVTSNTMFRRLSNASQGGSEDENDDSFELGYSSDDSGYGYF